MAFPGNYTKKGSVASKSRHWEGGSKETRFWDATSFSPCLWGKQKQRNEKKNGDSPGTRTLNTGLGGIGGTAAGSKRSEKEGTRRSEVSFLFLRRLERKGGT